MTNIRNVASHSSLLKLVERYANRVFGLVVFILSVGSLVLAPHLSASWNAIFVSIGTSLLASLIFAIIYSGVSERYHMLVIRNDLAQCIREEMKEVMHAYRAFTVLDNHKTEAELQQFLTNIGCDCNILPLSELRKDAETFDTNFRKDLKMVN